MTAAALVALVLLAGSLEAADRRYEVMEVGEWTDYFPTWSFSPDGRDVVFQRARGERLQLFVLRLATGELRSISNGKANDGHPSWSPDGASILFASDRGGALDLYRLDPASGGVSRLLPRAVSEGRARVFPTGSPDGRFVAYVERDLASGRRLLYVLARDEMEPRQLYEAGPGLGHPVWSPDGALVFHRQSPPDGWNDLYSVSPEGGAARRLTHNRGNDTWSPAWSPDGTIWTFVEGVDKDPFWRYFNYELFAEDREDGRRRRLTMAWGGDDGQRFTPDGRQIVFQSTRTGYREMWIMQADGTRVRQLTHQPEGELTRLAEESGLDEAVAYYRKVRAGDPEVLLFSPRAGERLLHLRLARGDVAGASKVAGLLVDTYAESARAHGLRAFAAAWAGQSEESARAFEHSLSLDNDPIEPVDQLGTVELVRRLGAAPEGLSEVALNRLGYRLIGSGNAEAAIVVFRALVDRFPDSANAWDSLGEVLTLLWDRKGAIRAFERSLELDPGNRNAQRHLKVLRPEEGEAPSGG